MAARKQTKPRVDFTAVGDALDALCKAVAGPDFLREPPPGFLSVKDYAKRIGISEGAAGDRLRRSVSEGRIESVLVKTGNHYSKYYAAK